MILESLFLKHFRNYSNHLVNPSEGITVIYGANGTGKTNLLEAIHLLSVGRSHRTSNDREMIEQGSLMAISAAKLRRLDGTHKPEVRLFRAEKPHKRVFLNNKPASRIGDLMGHATVIMFAPEDLRIVRDNPAARRRFMDMQLSQIRPIYLQQLRHYLNILENRNALLREQKKQGVHEFSSQMDVWDEQLAIAAVPIVQNRIWFIDKLKELAGIRYADISENANEPFCLRYNCAVQKPEITKDWLLEALQNSRKEDVQRAFTYHGPHRDDLALTLCGRDLRAYGSQGQVRTAVLSMKLGEIQLIREEMGEAPVLLLDDVFSELDIRRRQALLVNTKGIQTMITCADRSDAAQAKADAFLLVTQTENGSASIQEQGT